MNIGVFDSGLGGLSILRHLTKKCLKYNFIYLGDNAHVPYGGRSSEIIYQFTKKSVDYLFRQNCKLIIIACNTVTAVALRKIQDNYLKRKYPDRKVLGVILPAAEIISEKGYKKIGVIGTKATINSKEFAIKIKELSKKTEVIEKACPLLVSAIEEGTNGNKVVELLLKKYLMEFKEKKVEALILGCTHYGLIKNKIKKMLGKNVDIIDEGEICADKLIDYLKRHPEIDKCLGREGVRRYCVTDKPKRYRKFFEIFLGNKFKKEDELELVRL